MWGIKVSIWTRAYEREHMNASNSQHSSYDGRWVLFSQWR
jgi:hypothetical protein